MIAWRGGLLVLFLIGIDAKAVSDGGKPVVDHVPALAMVCGKVTQHRDTTTGEWVTGTGDCIQDEEDMLNYCKEVYPTLEITNVVKEIEPVHVPSWCQVGSPPPCRGHGHNVRPVKCVEGRYEPKAIDVKQGCTFEHTMDYEIYHTQIYWQEKAARICSDKGKTMSDPQMLKPAPGAVDQWYGVQFLCCEAPDVAKPKPSKGKTVPAAILDEPVLVDKKPAVNAICLQPKKIGFCRALLPAWHFNSTSQECEFFHYGGCGGNDNNFQTKLDCMKSCQPEKAAAVEPEPDNSICGLPSDSGLCMALFFRYYYDPAIGACKQFVYGGCGGNENKFMMKEDCEAKCRGYRPESMGVNLGQLPPVLLEPGPVLLGQDLQPAEDSTTSAASTTTPNQVYTDKTTLDNEHDVFADKLDAIKAEHQQKVNKILAKWEEDNSDISEENREKMDQLEEDLQITISNLEDDYDGRMESLNNYHMGRMDQMINQEREKTLQRFLDQLRSDRPKVRHILSALEKYIEVEKQDKSHIMQHYYMAVNDEFDVDGIPDLKQRLDDIDTRVSKARDTLQQYPDIFNRIQDEIEEILSTMPESPDFEADGMSDEEEDFEDEESVTTESTTERIKIDDGGLPDPDICLLKPDVGPCRASLQTYYFNTETNKCDIFYYGGCAGNENNFRTLEECMEACPAVPEFSNSDTDGVLDSEDILPEEDEFDIGTDGDPGMTDDNSIQGSFIDDVEEMEHESVLDSDVDKQFNINGDRVFDVQVNPAPLANTDMDMNEASLASNWVVWTGLAVGMLVIIIAAIAIALRRSQVRPPMRIVVEKPPEETEKELSAEEKQLLALQQNGYENPTYKFFEKQMA